jgi:hypothetical protein
VALATVLIVAGVSPLGAETITPTTIALSAIAVRTNYAVLFFPALSATESCGAFSSTAAVIDWGTNAENKNLYIAAVAALHSGAKVGFTLNGCSTAEQAPLITRLVVTP